MYVLIERERLPQGRHYERMPDGRCIVSGREAKMMGALEGVTIVPNTAILNMMRQEMAASPDGDGKDAQADEGTGTSGSPAEDAALESLDDGQGEGKEDGV